MEQRSGAGAAALGGFVYVVGGYDGIRQLNSIERYDPEKNSWKLVCPMMYRRSALGVAMMDGHLYAIGGYDGDGFLSSVEVYDPDRNSWTLGASLSVGRSGAGVTVGWIPSLWPENKFVKHEKKIVNIIWVAVPYTMHKWNCI